MIGTVIFITSCTPSFDPLAKLRGSRQILIRLPQQPGQLQEDIIIVRDASRGTTDVSYGPSNPQAPGVTLTSYDHVALDEATWITLNDFQKQWCQEQPQWQTPPTYYIVALQCPNNTRYLGYVSETDLPPILRTIIQLRP